MTDFIENIFFSIFGNNVVLATILIAIIPIIELKGAIPFSMSPEIWGSFALPYWEAFIYGLIGSSLIVPILALLYVPIINWLKKTKIFKSLAEKLENRVNSKKQTIESKAEEKTEEIEIRTTKKERQKRVYDKKFFLKFFGVFAFVAIPLPLTGVWTGTCIAVALGLGFGWTCLSVISGNIVAGLLITLASTLFGDATMIFVYILIGVVFLALIISLIRKLIRKQKDKKEKLIQKNTQEDVTKNKEQE